MANVYFVVELDGVNPTIAPADVCVVTGRDIAQITAATSADGVGVYSDGMGGYLNSATFVGTLHGKQVMLLRDSGGVAAFTAYLTDNAVKGKRLSAASIYRETADDDGISVQNGKSYIKYVATYE